MKKVFLLTIAQLSVWFLHAQQELHIHQINVENGDATIVGIYDIAQQKYTAKILIDGGQSSAEKMLLPYISKMIGSDEESHHFNYIILTHYHDDHYTGLLAIENGSITADSIIDPCGYRVSSYFRHSAAAGGKPGSLKIALAWLAALKAATHHMPEPFVKGRSKVMIRFDATASTSLGHKIVLGRVGNNDVELKCIAGWGNTLIANGQIKRNPSPEKSNANNFTLAFILKCGQFRYFIGGDMGGSGGTYINQETSVTEYLRSEYPVSTSFPDNTVVAGHVCGFKANHHGSNNSNTAGFIEGMHPCIILSSGGDNKSWHLPNPLYIQRLASVEPLSESATGADSVFNKGVYFTNLYNFNNSFRSLTVANTNFKNKDGISYDYGNNSASVKASYLIKVSGDNDLSHQSAFEAGRVDTKLAVPYKRLAFFFCHKE